MGCVKPHAGKIQSWNSHTWKLSLPHNSSHFLCNIGTSQLRSLNLTTASSHGITLTWSLCFFYSSVLFCILCFPICCSVSSSLAIPSSAVSPAPFSHITRTISYSSQHLPPSSKMSVSPVIWENIKIQHPQTHMTAGTDIFPMSCFCSWYSMREIWYQAAVVSQTAAHIKHKFCSFSCCWGWGTQTTLRQPPSTILVQNLPTYGEVRLPGHQCNW